MKNDEKTFHVRFWGVRGSYPTSSQKTLRYGGHTACVEVSAGGHCLIFDAGTGMIDLGKQLLKNRRRPLRLNVFLSHAHHDHLFGLYFFEPLIDAQTELFFFGPDFNGKSLRSTLESAMGSPFFPVSLKELDALKQMHSLKGGEMIHLVEKNRGPRVSTARYSALPEHHEVAIATHKSIAHPKNGVMLYRIHYRGKSVVYATDIEEKRGGYPEVIDFAREADLLIHDAQYRAAEYFSRVEPRKGWGHSTVERAVQVAKKAHVKRLVLFHHEPTHDDRTIKQMERHAQALFPATSAAYEGLAVDLLGPSKKRVNDRVELFRRLPAARPGRDGQAR